MPYDGNPEIKEANGAKYLYMRKRVVGKLTSTYVDVYSNELYQLLLRNAKERKDFNKTIRKINKDLSALGYEDKALSTRVLHNLDFARANMKANIYDQAVLEGVATTLQSWKQASICYFCQSLFDCTRYGIFGYTGKRRARVQEVVSAIL